MNRVLIFAGTTEGKNLAYILAQNKIYSLVCVATEYGKQVMEENAYITVLEGRKTVEEMEALYRSDDFCAVVDATHPFAGIVTENILKSLENVKIPYFRLLRNTNIAAMGDVKIHYYDSVENIVDTLIDTTGNVLLTTGSKDLHLFTSDDGLRERLFARVLPGRESLEICYDNKLSGKQIIAMQGPFSEEMNLATIKQYEIEHLVTKQSGKIGGVDEKISAAIKTGIEIHIIRTPKQEAVHYDLQSVCRKLAQILDMNIDVKARLSITIAGIGMGDEDTKTEALNKAIKDADYIFGARRMIEKIESGKAKYPIYLPTDILSKLSEIEEAEIGDVNVLILYSGDTGFFSGSKKMCDAIEDKYRVKLLPGISSISAFASKIRTSWQDMTIISTHGTYEKLWKSQILFSLRRGEKLFFITSGLKDIKQIAELLIKNGLQDQELFIGFNISYESEKIQKLLPNELLTLQDEGLYVGAILNPISNSSFALTPGIGDGSFVTRSVPMTKEEVREISICKLGLSKNSIVYDIGSGTGTISVEMARLSPTIQVYAIENNPDAVELTKVNIEKFGLENVTIIEATAPDMFDKLPVASHAFIGGSRGNLREIVAALYKINPEMKVVMNAISLENIVNMQSILKEYDLKNSEIIQVAVTRAKEVGDYHLMQANNPITIFTFQFDKGEKNDKS